MVVQSVKRGNTKTISLLVKEGENKTPKDISGHTIYFTVKKSLNDFSDDDVDAVIQKTIQATSSVGLATIYLSKEDTKITPMSYMYDIKLKNQSGTWVKSTCSDKFIVSGVVTNS